MLCYKGTDSAAISIHIFMVMRQRLSLLLHEAAHMCLSDGAWGHRTPLGPLHLPSSQQPT